MLLTNKELDILVSLRDAESRALGRTERLNKNVGGIFVRQVQKHNATISLLTSMLVSAVEVKVDGEELWSI